MEGLISHVDTTRVPREALVTFPTPEPTSTHLPVPHHRLVDALHESLAMRHLGVVREDYAVSEDAMRFFGVLTLEVEETGVRFAIGLRNSHDKTFAMGLIAGYRVVVCDNLAFYGMGVRIARKHTRRVEVEDTVAVAVDKIHRAFEPMRRQIGFYRGSDLTDQGAKIVIYDAFIAGNLEAPKHLASDVHRHYFAPEHPEFEGRNAWSLANAFTSAFQEIEPIPRFKATAKLAGFLDRHFPSSPHEPSEAIETEAIH